MSNQLYGKLARDGTKKIYVYAINMTLDEVYNSDKKKLWDRKAVSFGIITSEELPPEVSVKTVDFRAVEMYVSKSILKYFYISSLVATIVFVQRYRKTDGIS